MSFQWKKSYKIYKITITLVLMLFTLGAVLSQVPKGVPQPHNNEPPVIDSVFDVLLYIVFPVVLVTLYFFWRRRELKKKKEQEDQK